MALDETMNFKLEKDKNLRTREILKEVYEALQEKGYHPINQIVGYILSGDPTYITSHKDARNLIRQIEGDARVGPALTDPLGFTAQGLETIHHQGNDKIVLKRLEEILQTYEIDAFVIGMPVNMNGTKTERVEVTEKFIHKLKCKFPKIQIETIDERLTTVAAHRTMNFLEIDGRKKKNIVDTISAVYILETYMRKKENNEEK